jgi:hypothetical protein
MTQAVWVWGMYTVLGLGLTSSKLAKERRSVCSEDKVRIGCMDHVKTCGIGIHSCQQGIWSACVLEDGLLTPLHAQSSM